MFEDERERVSHRRGAIARGVAKRGLVAFLAFAMAFGTTPAQLWAEGAEGIAEAVAQAAPLAENGSGESATSPAADLNASGMVANGGTAEQDATATASGPTDKTEDDSAAGNEAPAASTSDASKQDTAVVSAAGEAKAQPAKAESQEVSATCSVIGTDAEGAQQTWAAAQRITLKEGSTAADLSEQLFKQCRPQGRLQPQRQLGLGTQLDHVALRLRPHARLRLGDRRVLAAVRQRQRLRGRRGRLHAQGRATPSSGAYSKYGDPAPVAQVCGHVLRRRHRRQGRPADLGRRAADHAEGGLDRGRPLRAAVQAVPASRPITTPTAAGAGHSTRSRRPSTPAARSPTTRRPALTGSCSSTAAPPRSARAATRSRTATPSSGATRSTATPRLSLRSLPRAPSSAPTPRAPSRPGPPRSGSR